MATCTPDSAGNALHVTCRSIQSNFLSANGLSMNDQFTKAQWFRWLDEIGCIVCLNEGRGHSPADKHHIHSPQHRRMGDLATIPLCPIHHRHGINNEVAVSRHPWKHEFERRYGNEHELYDQVLALAIQMRHDALPHAE